MTSSPSLPSFRSAQSASKVINRFVRKMKVKENVKRMVSIFHIEADAAQKNIPCISLLRVPQFVQSGTLVCACVGKGFKEKPFRQCVCFCVF